MVKLLLRRLLKAMIASASISGELIWLWYLRQHVSDVLIGIWVKFVPLQLNLYTDGIVLM